MKIRERRNSIGPWGLALILVLGLVCLAAPARANTIAAGSAHSLGVKADGTVVAWGANWRGPVRRPGGPERGGGGGRRGNPQPGPEGRRHRGRLGIGHLWPADNVPAGLSGVVAVAAGEFHSLALKADGTVVAWGGDNYWASATSRRA